MNYRSADGVLQARYEEGERELAALKEREGALTAECEREEASERQLAERFRIAGLGGAERGPTIDRINVLLKGLCLVGMLVALPEMYIGGYVRRQPEESVIPILLLGGPGILAAVVAWPYRALHGYRGWLYCALGLIAFAIGNVVVGWGAR